MEVSEDEVKLTVVGPTVWVLNGRTVMATRPLDDVRASLRVSPELVVATLLVDNEVGATTIWEGDSLDDKTGEAGATADRAGEEVGGDVRTAATGVVEIRKFTPDCPASLKGMRTPGGVVLVDGNDWLEETL